MRRTDQQLSHIGVPLFGNAQLWVTISRLISFRSQSQISSYRTAFAKSLWIFQSQHKGQRRQRSDTFDLSEDFRLGIFLHT